MEEKIDTEGFGIDGQSYTDLRVKSTSDVETRSTETPGAPRAASKDLCLLAFAFGICCIFSYLNFGMDEGASIQSRYIPTLDLAYQPELDLDIVLDMYDENLASTAPMISKIRSLPNIANKTTRMLIYCKGEELIKLSNIGREGEAYLNHIVTKYDDLARHT
ncbi:hypothetical protein E2P81_ATG06849 [Venturia nashicola]|nr:hypothetical protein E2P81_ATG06849 [Venturia nashicola]